MKFGIREAVDVCFRTTAAVTDQSLLGRDWAKGEPVLYFDTLKTSTTEGTATTVYAQGGAGNPRLIAWEGDKTITFTFEDALISAESLTILSGASTQVAEDAASQITLHKKTVTSGSYSANEVTINLSATGDIDDTNGEVLVTTNADIYGFRLDTNGEIVQRLGQATGSVTSASVIFSQTEYTASPQTLLVDYYVTRSASAQELTIEANKFAGYFYIEGDTLFKRQADGKELPARIIIPNAKIQSNFSLSMSPTGDPSTFTFTADAFPGTIKGQTDTTKKVMYAIQILEN